MLYGSLGFPYYRLINIEWFPSLKIKKFGHSLTWKWKNIEFPFHVFDIWNSYPSCCKCFSCFVFAFSDHHLYKHIFKIDTHNLYIRDIFQTSLSTRIKNKKNRNVLTKWWVSLSKKRFFRIFRFSHMKIIFCKDDPMVFLVFVEICWW